MNYLCSLNQLEKTTDKTTKYNEMYNNETFRLDSD